MKKRDKIWRATTSTAETTPAASESTTFGSPTPIASTSTAEMTAVAAISVVDLEEEEKTVRTPVRDCVNW